MQNQELAARVTGNRDAALRGCAETLKHSQLPHRGHALRGAWPDHLWVSESLPERQAAAGLHLGTGMLAAVVSVTLIPGLTPGLVGMILEPSL